MGINPKPREATAATTSSTNGGAPPPAAPTLSSSSPPPTPPPLVLKLPKACEANPYPTTFVQADTSSFKQVVQMLTGSAETAAAVAANTTNSPSQKSPVPAAAKATGPKRPAFKLYERRTSLKNLRMISPLMPTFVSSNSNSPASAAAFSPRRLPEVVSPSALDFPSLSLSPVTPLLPDPFERRPPPGSDSAKWAEDRAIAEKGFYLHPSPRTAGRNGDPPQLLPLFPVTSPKASARSSPATTSNLAGSTL